MKPPTLEEQLEAYKKVLEHPANFAVKQLMDEIDSPNQTAKESK